MHIHDGVNGVSYPPLVVSARPDLGIVYALDIINHVQATPSTPQFTRVHLKQADRPDTNERNARSKCIRRMRMTSVSYSFDLEC